MAHNRSFLLWLIWAGIIEGTSTLVLFFIAMPLKYMYDMPKAVTVVGSIHGFLFIGLVMLFIIGRFKVPLSNRMLWAGILGAIVPFGPFIVDMKLYKMLQTQ